MVNKDPLTWWQRALKGIEAQVQADQVGQVRCPGRWKRACANVGNQVRRQQLLQCLSAV